MLAFCSESPLGSYSQPSYSDFPQNITKHILVQKQWYVTMVRWSEERIVVGHGEVAFRRDSLTARDKMDIQHVQYPKACIWGTLWEQRLHTRRVLDIGGQSCR